MAGKWCLNSSTTVEVPWKTMVCSEHSGLSLSHFPSPPKSGPACPWAGEERMGEKVGQRIPYNTVTIMCEGPLETPKERHSGLSSGKLAESGRGEKGEGGESSPAK